MSKLKEMQEQYQGYVAARDAVDKIKPKVEVVYKKHHENCDYDGVFVYEPENDRIVIRPARGDYRNWVHISSEDVPALIKALQEFIE
jgi:hypothetical protein